MNGYFHIDKGYIDICNTELQKKQFPRKPKFVKIITDKERGRDAVEYKEISKAALGRVPLYLRYLKSLPPEVQTVSATAVAKELGFGEVQVRKDLALSSSTGKPKVGYVRKELIESLEKILGCKNGGAVVVGAGKLGTALLSYTGFEE